MTTETERLEQLRRRTRRPTTAGEMVAGLLEELDLTQTELAQRLQVSRATINHLVNGHRPLTPDMARRLGRFFGDGAAVWMRMQQQVDLWDLIHDDTKNLTEIEPFSQPLAA